METKKENHKNLYLNILGFIKVNWALFVLLFFAFIVILLLVYVLFSPCLNKKSLENDIFLNKESPNLISISKIVCYSSAYGINNSETQARWNLNLSQYTDIAIYLDNQTNITSMYIDNISFSNLETGNLSLSYLVPEDFGKSPIASLETQSKNSNSTNTNNVENTIIVENLNKIELSLTSPITLRYLNQNLKENCVITDVDAPISFDGSLLKRGKVTLSSIKNTIFFTIHIIDSNNQDFSYPICIPINFENTDESKSIYDGSYMEEISISPTKS